MAEHSCTNSTDDSNWGTENDVSRHQTHTHTHTHIWHVLFMHTLSHTHRHQSEADRVETATVFVSK